MAQVETLWRGSWWLPDKRDEEQLGVLLISETGEVRLELVYGFDDNVRTRRSEGVFQESPGTGVFPMILGQSGSEAFTLLGCQTLGKRTHLGSAMSVPHDHVIGASRCLRGVALITPEDPIFSKIEVEIDYLLPWTGLTTMSAQLMVGKEGWAGEQEAKSKSVEGLAAAWRDYSFTVEVSHTSFGYGFPEPNVRVLNSTERASLEISIGMPVSCSGFDSMIKQIQDLVTLGMNKPCSIGLRRLSLSEDIGPTGRNRFVDVYGKQIYRRGDEPVGHPTRDVIFTLRDAAFETVLPNWLDLYEKLHIACGMLFGLQYIPDGYSETRMMTVASALESIHRELYPNAKPMPDDQFEARVSAAESGLATEEEKKWLRQRLHNTPSYRQRAQAVARIPDEDTVALLIAKTGKWATKITDARHGLAHADDHGERPDPELTYVLTEVTNALLYLVLLSELGLSPEVQRRAVGTSPIAAAAARFKALI